MERPLKRADIIKAFTELGATGRVDLLGSMPPRMYQLEISFPTPENCDPTTYSLPECSDFAKNIFSRLGQYSSKSYKKFVEHPEGGMDPDMLCAFPEVRVCANPMILGKLLDSGLMPTHTRYSPIEFEFFDTNLSYFYEGSFYRDPWYAQPLKLKHFLKYCWPFYQEKSCPYTASHFPTLDATEMACKVVGCSVAELQFYASCFGVPRQLAEKPILWWELFIYDAGWFIEEPTAITDLDYPIDAKLKYLQFIERVVRERMRDKSPNGSPDSSTWALKEVFTENGMFAGFI